MYRGQGCCLRRFGDDGAPGCECGRPGTGRIIRRKIPGGNDPDDADRLPDHGASFIRPAGGDHPPIAPFRFLSVPFEKVGRYRPFTFGFRQGLAAFQHHVGGQFVQTVPDQLGGLLQYGRPGIGGSLTPGFKGLCGGGDSPVAVRGAGIAQFGDRFLRRGIDEPDHPVADGACPLSVNVLQDHIRFWF